MTGQRKALKAAKTRSPLDLYEKESLVDHGILCVFRDGNLECEEKFLVAERRGNGFLGLPKKEFRIASEIRAPGYEEVMTTSFGFSSKLVPISAGAAIQAKRGDVVLSQSSIDMKLKAPQSTLKMWSDGQKKPVQIKTGFNKQSVACVQPSVAVHATRLLDKAYRKKGPHTFEVVEIDTADTTLPSFSRTRLEGGFAKTVSAETDMGDPMRLDYYVFEGRAVKGGKTDGPRVLWHFWTDKTHKLQKLMIQQEDGERQIIRKVDKTPIFTRLRP